jgi:hypothetical protein
MKEWTCKRKSSRGREESDRSMEAEGKQTGVEAPDFFGIHTAQWEPRAASTVGNRGIQTAPPWHHDCCCHSSLKGHTCPSLHSVRPALEMNDTDGLSKQKVIYPWGEGT